MSGSQHSTFHLIHIFVIKINTYRVSFQDLIPEVHLDVFGDLVFLTSGSNEVLSVTEVLLL